MPEVAEQSGALCGCVPHGHGDHPGCLGTLGTSALLRPLSPYLHSEDNLQGRHHDERE